MEFVPWWRSEYARDRVAGLGWMLIAGPFVVVVLVVLFFPDQRDELPEVAPALLVAMPAGLALLVLERRLRPRRHHAQVLYVNMSDFNMSDAGQAPYYYSMCECRWFGGVHESDAEAFESARRHTQDVDEDVVAVSGTGTRRTGVMQGVQMTENLSAEGSAGSELPSQRSLLRRG